MMVVKDKIIAFREGGEMLVFDSRAEFGVTDKEEEGITLIFASPGDLYRHLMELEDEKENDEEKVRVADQVWKQESVLSEADVRAEQGGDEEAYSKDYEKQIEDAVVEGEFSEATIRAIKAREDDRQRMLLEGKER